jgi:hypothetical protein
MSVSNSEKSILAKLLASENIRIEHQKVATAAFNLQDRALILPIWKEMSADLYDLLIGHEIGHALYTPAAGWHDAITDGGNGIKSFLNILEDARIERKVKDKYPGIRKNFYAGYKELFERNFFGVEGRDLDTLRFIDRVNLYYKVGAFLNIQFSEDEKAILRRIDVLETWEEVSALATELYGLAKTEQTPEETAFDELMDQLGGMMGDEFDMDSSSSAPSETSDGQSDDESEETDDTQDGEGQSGGMTDETDNENTTSETDEDESGENGDDQEYDSREPDGSKGFQEEPYYNENPIAETDEHFRNREDELVDDKSRPYVYGNLTIVKPSDYIIPMKRVIDSIKITVRDGYNTVNSETDATKVYNEFRANNQKYINLMVQEFEMRRKASEFARATVAKTGRLDTDRLWAHKISEDLFARHTIMPNGKNHGMLMFLDMSGSMDMNMKGTIEQMVTLAMFARKVRIPMEVYGFINNQFAKTAFPEYNREHREITTGENKNDIQIADSNFFLYQFLDGSCSSAQFNNAVKELLHLGHAYDNRRMYGNYNNVTYRYPDHFGLGSTPLEESVIVARSIAEQFRSKHRLEVLSTVFLTDGDGDNNFSTNTHNYYGNSNLTIEDAKTRKSVTVKYDRDKGMRSAYSNALLELYGQVTGSRVINFFIVAYSEKHTARRMLGDDSNFDTKWKTEWVKDRVFTLDNHGGFHNRFLVPGGKNLQIGTDTLTVDSENTKQIFQAFKKMQNGKQANRVLLTKMIRAVA